MELRCLTCAETFTRANVAPGDAVMCPRCRTLVVALASEPPMPAVPVRATLTVSAPAGIVRAGTKAGGAGGASGSRPPGERIALLRTCPGCRGRYDVDCLACPSCGEHVNKARAKQADVEEERRGQFWENVELWLCLVGALVILTLGGFALRGEDLQFVLMGGAAGLLLGWRVLRWAVARRRARNANAAATLPPASPSGRNAGRREG